MAVSPSPVRRLVRLVAIVLLLAAAASASWAAKATSRRAEKRIRRSCDFIAAWRREHKGDLPSGAAIAVGLAVTLAWAFAVMTPFADPGAIVMGVGILLIWPAYFIWLFTEVEQRDRWASWVHPQVVACGQRFSGQAWFVATRNLTNGLRLPCCLLLFNVGCEVVSPNTAFVDAFGGPEMPRWATSGLIVVTYPIWNAILIMTAIVLFAVVRGPVRHAVLRLFDRATGWRWFLRQVVPLPTVAVPPGIVATLGGGMTLAMIGLLALPSWAERVWTVLFVGCFFAWGIWANIRCFSAGAVLGPLVYPAMALGAWFLANAGSGSLASVSVVTWVNLAANTIVAMMSTVVATVQIAARWPCRQNGRDRPAGRTIAYRGQPLAS